MSNSEIKRTLQSLLPGTRYSVRARAYNNYNVYSDWSEALEFVTPEDDGVPNPVTTVTSSFGSPDLLLAWTGPSLNVDGSPCNDVAYYRLDITGYSGLTKTYKSLNESFQLTFAIQKKDFGTPIPNPHVVITVVDTANNESTTVSVDPVNLEPDKPTAPTVEGVPGALSVTMSASGVEDFYYFILEVSTNNTTWSTLYSGADDTYHHAVAGGLTRYYRYKIVDRFGQESVVSDSVSGTAISLSTTHSHYLEDLLDVNATPNEGDILYWDGAFWSATPGAGIGGAPVGYLGDLLDVDTTGESSGKFLKYNGSQWVPQTSSLNSLTDVNTSGAASGKVLKYNGSQWVPQDDDTVSYLNSLLDVNTSGQSIGDVLTFDGYQWVPATPTGGDGGGGGGGSSSSNWTLVDYLSGDSVGDWVNVNGSTLTTSGSEISQSGVGGVGTINRYDGAYIPEIAIVEADVRFDAFTGSDSQVAIGFMKRSGYTNSNTVSLYTGPGDGTIPRVYITNWGTGVGDYSSLPSSFVVGTWYTIRIVRIGSAFQVYFDGAYVGSVAVSPNNSNDRLGFFGYNADSSIKNIKVWQTPIGFLDATPTWPGGSGGTSLVYVDSNPPLAPQDGELWWDSDTGTLSMWYAHSSVWVETSGSGGFSGSGSGAAHISPDPPATPTSGEFWFDEDTGSTYLYYDTPATPIWVEVGASGLGGGITWTQVVNESGTTDTNWTTNNGTGTWSSDGTSINQTGSIGSAWGALYLKDDVGGSTADSVRTAMTIYEAEVQCPSGCLVGLTFSRRYNNDSNGQVVYYIDPDADALKLSTFGLSNLLNDSVVFAPDTWYKLRIVLVGSSLDLYYDNGSGLTYRASIFVQDESGIAFKFGLAVFGGTAKFKNIKAWNGGLSLPA